MIRERGVALEAGFPKCFLSRVMSFCLFVLHVFHGLGLLGITVILGSHLVLHAAFILFLLFGSGPCGG